MPLAMNVKLTLGSGKHLLSTTRAAGKGVFTRFEAESWLIAEEKKIRSRKSPHGRRVHLHGTIAKRPTNYLVTQVK